MSVHRGHWEDFLSNSWYYPSVGFGLDTSRAALTSEFLSSMKEKIAQAFSAMKDLENGSIANPDEDRMVGHYWLRDEDLAPTHDLQTSIRQMRTSVLHFARQIHTGKILSPGGETFTDCLVVGIGGSALGPQLVADALSSSEDKMRMHFCDNTDPDGMQRLLTQLSPNFDRLLVLVISKSGGTPETRNGSLEVWSALEAAGNNPEKHFVAVTSEGSKLDELAKKQGWLSRFPMWDWVGGRTSLFSAVGLLPAALQGIDVVSFLNGAKRMDAISRENDEENPSMRLALCWYSLGEGKGKKDMVVLPYKDRLVLFSKYLQQLVMESLGKEKDLQGNVVHQGIAVYGNKGSTDQHAYVQQLRDGIPNFFVTFIRVLKDFAEGTEAPRSSLQVEPGITSGDYLQGFYLGTRGALAEAGRASISVSLNELSPSSLGALIALYERAVGFYASLVGINAYHQPGVEAGKKAAGRILEIEKLVFQHLAQHPQPQTAEEIADAISAPEETESIFLILDYLAQNRRAGIHKIAGSNARESSFAVGG